MFRRMLLSLCIVGGILASWTAVYAEEGSLSAGRERVLAGHGFLPSLYVNEPWVSSNFRNYTGGAVAVGLETPFRNLAGEEIFVLQGDIFFANLGLGYQQQLGDSWALGLSLGGSVRSGTNAQSLVAEGANLDRTLNSWIKKRLLRSERSQLTVGLDWMYDKTFVITPQRFARAIIDGEDLETATLLDSIKAWQSRLTVDYAHAFSPTYGLRANGYIGLYEVPFTKDTSKATHRLGILLEMDLNPKRGIPLGISLGHTFGFPRDEPNSGLSGTLFGLWFTGREAFVAGVETGYLTFNSFGAEEKLDAMYGIFTIRYYM